MLLCEFMDKNSYLESGCGCNQKDGAKAVLMGVHGMQLNGV